MRLTPRKWSHFYVGLLCLTLGVLALRTGYIGRLWFPELSTSGLAARVVGALWLIVAAICFKGAYSNQRGN